MPGEDKQNTPFGHDVEETMNVLRELRGHGKAREAGKNGMPGESLEDIAAQRKPNLPEYD